MIVDRAELLSRKISTIDDAKKWIADLIAADLMFHFEDDPATIGNTRNGEWINTFSADEVPLVRARLDEVYGFEFCPLGHAIEIIDGVELGQ